MTHPSFPSNNTVLPHTSSSSSALSCCRCSSSWSSCGMGQAVVGVKYHKRETPSGQYWISCHRPPPSRCRRNRCTGKRLSGAAASGRISRTAEAVGRGGADGGGWRKEEYEAVVGRALSFTVATHRPCSTSSSSSSNQSNLHPYSVVVRLEIYLRQQPPPPPPPTRRTNSSTHVYQPPGCWPESFARGEHAVWPPLTLPVALREHLWDMRSALVVHRDWVDLPYCLCGLMLKADRTGLYCWGVKRAVSSFPGYRTWHSP